MGITENKIRCKKCGEIIESKTVHDYVSCKCGACAVDGGHAYLRRSGYLEDWEDLSVFANDEEKQVEAPVAIVATGALILFKIRDKIEKNRLGTNEK